MSVSTAKPSVSTTMKRVGIWIRVSTEDQVRGESPEHHEARARMYAQMKGWEVVEVYRLEGLSGKSVMGYPETQRMLRDVEEGRIDALIFSKLARLARNVKELLEFSELFERHGADLVSLQESIDTSTPAGRLFYTIIAAMAQWEREEIAERVAASVPIRARLGKPLGGSAPFGYLWKEKRLEINPDEAPVVVRAFEVFRERKRLLTTARILNQEGYRARKSRFTHTTVERMLRDPVYKGRRRANYTKSLGDGKSWRMKPESEWVYYEVPAITSNDLWEECNQVLREREGRYPTPPKEGRHLFSGLLICECGGKMYVSWRAAEPKYRCYRCNAKIEEWVVRDQYLDGLRTMVLKPEQIQEADQMQGTIEEREKRLALLRKELHSIDRRIDDLVTLFGEKLLDKPSFAARFEPLREQREQLTQEIPRLQGEIDYFKTACLAKTHTVEQARTFAALWPSLTPEEQRMAVKELVHSVKVGHDTLTYTFYWLPEFATSDHAAIKSARTLRDSSQRPA